MLPFSSRGNSEVPVRATSRLRQSASTLVAIGAVLAITATLTIGTVVLLDQQGTRGIQSELETRAGPDLALRASLALASNPSRQDEQVRAAIASSFAGAQLDVQVVRTLESHVTVLALTDDPDEAEHGGSARSIPDFDERADLVLGAAPVAPNEVAVQDDAADELGLAPGDEVLLAGERFIVSGTWQARDLLDPRWFGDPMIDSGFDEDYGPFVIDESAWGRLDLNPSVFWTIVPDARQIDAGNIDAIIGSWNRIRDAWRPTVAGLESLTSQNPLVQTLRGLETQLDGLRAAEPVIFSLIGAAALVGLAELIRLLVATRARVSALYWARGDSRGGIARRTAVDVALAGLIGALIGTAAAAAGTAALWGVAALARVGPAVLLPTAVVLAGAIVIAVVASRPDEPRGGRTARAAGAVRRAALPGIAVLLALAAILSVWQLRLYGSPLTPTVEGLGDVDPVAVLAPALSLAAAVLVFVVAMPRIAVLLERWARRRRLTTQLAARGIRARIALLTAPLVLMALATGTVTVAAAYSATWDRAFTETAALRAGSDLHANARAEGITAQAQDAVLALDGVTAAAPLEVQPLSVGGESGTLLGVAPEALLQLATSVEGAFDPAAAAEQIQSDLPGPVLPADASAVLLTVRTDGLAAPPTLSLYLGDPLGFLRSASAELEGVEGAAGGEQTLTYAVTSLPVAPSGPWRVASIDLRFAEQEIESSAELHLVGLEATGSDGGTETVPLDQFWMADSPGLLQEPPATDPDGTGLILPGATTQARLTPSLTGTVDDRPRPRILVSQQLATRFDVALGDTLSFPLQDGIERLDCIVAGVLPAVPGAAHESAVLIDLGVVQHYQLRTTEVPADPRDLWIGSGDPTATASAVRAELPANTRIDSALDPVGRGILGSASVALWAAAIGVLLLAIIGIATSASARLRSARTDIAVLRALGLSSVDQGRIPSGELRTVLILGLVVGLLSGGAVAALTVPFFARAAVTAPYFSLGTALRFDPVGWVVPVGVLVAAAAAVVAVMAARVRALVPVALPGEDTE
jgi:hypothetical protein